MNHKMVLRTLGYIFIAEGAMLLLPLLVSLCYRDGCALALLFPALLCGAVGVLLAMLLGHDASPAIHAREGFVIVALAWIFVSAFGALPFVFSRSIPNYINAFFETVSGFTTTGSTILTDVEALPRSMLFWRSFTHWIGGMGVLVFVLTVIPMTGSGAVYLIRAEMTGPAPGKLVPRLKETAKILYLIYLGLTVIETLILWAEGMPLFESLLHSFGTAGTGGFGLWNNSIAHYESSLIHWTITLFMFLFGINFNLYYFLLLKQWREFVANEELRTYFLVVAGAALIIALNIRGMYQSFAIALRDAAFQVSSIVTTTGYVTANYDLWPELSKSILIVLMFMGACAGSTGGGMKVIRFMLMNRIVRRGVKRMLHPRSVDTIRVEGKPAPAGTVEGISVYLMAYVSLAVGAFLLISLDNFPFAVNLSAVIACLNNIGPGLDAVGAVGNYAAFSWHSKLVLCVAMLAGRLDIFPLVILASTILPSRKNGGGFGAKKHRAAQPEDL